MKVVYLLLLSGTIAIAQHSEVRIPGSFTAIKVSEGIDLYLKKSNRESVKLEVEGTDPENVITELSGEYLKIYLKPGHYRHLKVKALVTYVQLSRLTASSAAHVYSDDPVQSSYLRINASSDATIELSIEAEEAEVHVSSAADVGLKGKATKLIADISSAGSLQALDCRADVVVVEVSSAGMASVHAIKELEARASSAGTIRCKGNPPRFLTHSSSAGKIKAIE